MPLDADALADVIAQAVKAAIAPLRERIAVLEAVSTKGMDGAPGPPGPPGPPGIDGVEGAPGRDGRDGLPGVPGLQGEKGVDGKDGRDGLNGKDGLGFDDLDVTHDGEREIAVTFQRGELVKRFPLVLPSQIHRGIWKADTRYRYQDVTTWAGSQWVCMAADTTGKPGDAGSGWLLVVKHGRDGKDGKDGKHGLNGKDGAPGKDGRYLG